VPSFAPRADFFDRLDDRLDLDLRPDAERVLELRAVVGFGADDSDEPAPSSAAWLASLA